MGRSIGDYITILIVCIVIMICAQTTAVNIQVSKAENYKRNCIDKIEASYFNENVIEDCISVAKENGYTLTVTEETIYADRPIFKLELIYPVNVSILGINEYPVTTGYAK